ncbi:Cholinesterase [Cladobotryum mycophilum]|uniref:Carboxylic ester hydrolase n=1 Tax=Cladobotryum mycophilum TaxID=491253 RepID=A0ABR0SRA4_9HYPO
MASAALLAISLYVLMGAGQPPTDRTRPAVTLPAGRVVGTSTGSVSRYLGIPFGAAPVRFDPPKPVDNWQGTYDASQYKPGCIQEFKYPATARNQIMKWFNSPPNPAGESEDCLYLDVFAPANAEEGSKAVMVWLFGGDFAFGTGSLPLYDGTSFAETQDVVVVTPSYRTNVFGFPGSPEKPMSEQNLGLLDQRLALEWVQRNIHRFGGDPDRVTLFGESAGGASVEILVTNPPTPVPFVGAIVHSGQGSVDFRTNNSAVSWKRLSKAAGCDSDRAAQLSPIYDGGVTYNGTGRRDRLSSTPTDSRIARVPLLIGSNANESSMFIYGQTDIKAFLAKSLPQLANRTDELLDAYPEYDSAGGPINLKLAAIVTEFRFQCPIKIVAEESAAVGIPTWRYYFDAGFPNTDIFPGSGAYHSSEISLVFGTYPRNGSTPYQVEVSRAMQKVWADFAKDPSRGPGWAAVPQISIFGGGVRPGGDDGTGKPVMEVGDPTNIDKRCLLYKDIYDDETLV